MSIYFVWFGGSADKTYPSYKHADVPTGVIDSVARRIHNRLAGFFSKVVPLRALSEIRVIPHSKFRATGG